MVSSQHFYESAWTLLIDNTRKCILQEDNKCVKYIVKIYCSNILKEDAHIKRDIKVSLMYGTILTFVKFGNFGTRC